MITTFSWKNCQNIKFSKIRKFLVPESLLAFHSMCRAKSALLYSMGGVKSALLYSLWRENEHGTWKCAYYICSATDKTNTDFADGQEETKNCQYFREIFTP